MPTQSNNLTLDTYGAGYRKELVDQHNTRTAVRDAGFLLKELSDSSIIVDCGCGGGSITLGIAQLFPDASVVGFDICDEVLELARNSATAAGIENVSFQRSSVYELPLDDNFCDVVLAHAVFQHLLHPELAIAEIHRILKPGGQVALRDDDRGSMIIAPMTDAIIEALSVMDWFLEHSGGDPFAGRKHRGLLSQAGFGDIICSATVEYDGTETATKSRGDLAASAFRGEMGIQAVASNRIEEQDRERLAKACEDWGRDQAAFDSITWCEALGTKPK